MTSHNWELSCWPPAVSPQWNYLAESSTAFITVFANIMFNSNTPVWHTPLCTANIYFLYCKNQLKPVIFHTVDHILMSNYNCRVWKCPVRTVLQFSYLNLSQIYTHRMVEVGRDLWRLPCPKPLLKQGHLELFSQDHVHMAFEYLWGRKFPNLTCYSAQ